MREREWFGIIRKISFENRFYLLLGALALFIVLEPVFDDNPIIVTTLGTLLLLAAIDCLSFQKKSFLASRWFGLLVLIMGWIVVASDNAVVRISYFSLRVLFLAFVSGALIYQTAKSREVSLPVIVGAIDGYLLLGVIGAGVFALVENLAPGSIQTSTEGVDFGSALYFSFVTMTTLGYGDFLPVSNAARSAAILLAVTGQLYVAVLIALLVGKFASQSGRPT